MVLHQQQLQQDMGQQMLPPGGVYLEGDGFGDDEEDDYGMEEQAPPLAIEN